MNFYQLNKSTFTIKINHILIVSGVASPFWCRKYHMLFFKFKISLCIINEYISSTFHEYITSTFTKNACFITFIINYCIFYNCLITYYNEQLNSVLTLTLKAKDGNTLIRNFWLIFLEKIKKIFMKKKDKNIILFQYMSKVFVRSFFINSWL